MKKLSKLLLVVLSVIMAMTVFAGCGGSGNGGQGDDSSEIGGSGNGGGKNVNLSVWIQISHPQAFAWIKKNFEKENPNIKLNIEVQSNPQLGMSLDSTLRQKDAPDVFATFGGLTVPTLYKGGLLMDLDDIIKPIEDDLVDNAQLNKRDGDGKYYSAPFSGFASKVIYYNKTGLKKLKGITDEEKATLNKEPSTYAELKEWARIIRKGGKQPMVSDFNTAGAPHFMMGMSSRVMPQEEFDKLCINDKNFNPYTQPSYVKSFELLKRYNDDGIFHDRITGFGTQTAYEEFYAGNALMLAGMSIDLNSYINGLPTSEIGVFPMPLEPDRPDVSPISAVYADVFCARSNTAHPEECKKLIKFLMKKETQDILVENNLYPANKNADISNANPLDQEILSIIQEKGATAFYQNFSFPRCDIQLLFEVTKIINGTATPKQSADQLAYAYKIAIMGE